MPAVRERLSMSPIALIVTNHCRALGPFSLPFELTICFVAQATLAEICDFRKGQIAFAFTFLHERIR
jgi:hypothetical protein